MYIIYKDPIHQGQTRAVYSRPEIRDKNSIRIIIFKLCQQELILKRREQLQEMDEKKENTKGIKKAAQTAGAWIKGHKAISIIILLVLLALIGLIVFLHGRSAGKAAEPGDETVAIERRDLVQSLTLSGSVESGAAYSVTSAITEVEVKQVNVQVGDTVRKGDVIALLDDSDLKENVNSASRSLSSAKKKNSQDISNAKRSLKNANEDKKVQTGRTSKEVQTATSQYNAAANELASLKSKLSAAKSERTSAKTELDRAEAAAAGDHAEINKLQNKIDDYSAQIAENEKEIDSGVDKDTEDSLRIENKTLWGKKRTEETALDTYKKRVDVANRLNAEASAQTAYDSAQAAVSNLEESIKDAEAKVAELSDARNKAVEEDKDAYRTSTRAVEDQKSSLNSTYDSVNDNLEAPRKELRKAQKDLDSSVVTAEADGIVTAVNVKPGDKYTGDAIAVIQDDSSYRVSASADQYDISSLAIGQQADITITAAEMNDTEGRLIYVGRTPMVSETGAVGTSGENTASSNTGADANYRVEAVIQEPSSKMRIGMTAKVVVTVWEKKDCLAVPDEAVRTDENGQNYVVVVDDKGKKKNVDVKYGMKTDYYSEIIGDGLKEGMNVLVSEDESTVDDTAETEE